MAQRSKPGLMTISLGLKVQKRVFELNKNQGLNRIGNSLGVSGRTVWMALNQPEALGPILYEMAAKLGVLKEAE